MTQSPIEKAREDYKYALRTVLDKTLIVQNLEEDLRVAKLKLSMAENHEAREREALKALESE